MPELAAGVEGESRSPLAGWSGRGVKLAVIDSGVHAGHPHIFRLAGGVAIGPDGAMTHGEEAWLDRLGHGTAVTAAIQEKAPEATVFVVKVFHQSLRTTGTALLAAIDWCVDNGMDLANLSLGSTNPAHRLAFSEAAQRAEAAGVLLVAAREADGAPCFPGSLPGVLGVGLDWDCPRDDYRRPGPGEEGLRASGYPRPIPGVEPRRNLYGVSFAVANMTGFAARACEAAGRSGPARRRPGLVRAVLERDRALRER
jgi:subtilisin family serine protease